MTDERAGEPAVDGDSGADSKLASSDISVDFSVEELLALADLLDIPVPPVVDASPFESVEDHEQSLAAARRALTARRILTIDGGATTVLPAVAQLLELISAPGIIGRVQYETVGLIETRAFAALPDVSVEHVELLVGVHRFTPFASEELLVRMLERCRLHERPSVEVDPFTVSFGDLMRSGTFLDGGDVDSATAVLVGAEVDERAARAFVDAGAHRVASSRLTVLHRPDEAHLVGGELTWFDGGEHGLWLTPTPDDSHDEEIESMTTLDEQPVTIEPTTAQAIAAEVLSYLPAGDPSAD